MQACACTCCMPVCVHTFALTRFHDYIHFTAHCSHCSCKLDLWQALRLVLVWDAEGPSEETDTVVQQLFESVAGADSESEEDQKTKKSKGSKRKKRDSSGSATAAPSSSTGSSSSGDKAIDHVIYYILNMFDCICAPVSAPCAWQNLTKIMYACVHACMRMHCAICKSCGSCKPMDWYAVCVLETWRIRERRKRRRPRRAKKTRKTRRRLRSRKIRGWRKKS